MKKIFPEKKVAIVADWLTSPGGAEHVVLALTEIFENVEVFTSVYNPDLFPSYQKSRIHTTFLQKLPAFIRNKHQFLLPFFPKAFQSLDLSQFDIIISSSSSGFSKCVKKTRDDQVHICYCHTPIRFLYNARQEYLETYPLPWFGYPIRWILPSLLNWLEKIDQAAVQNIDHFISNSDFVGERIQKYYGRSSTTIHPGIDTKPYTEASKTFQKKDFFLGIGRFIPYKKFDLLVDTFVRNKLPLKLIGMGPEHKRCLRKKELHKASNIEFLGFVPTADLPRYYAESKALLFPSEEDFGLVPVEAMSAGTPVIYYNRGGACESVADIGGIPFSAQTVTSLQSAIETLETQTISQQQLVERGQKFDVRCFQKNIQTFLTSLFSS